MKYIVLAILMFLLGALLTTFRPPESFYSPVVRMRSPAGFFVTYLRERVQGTKACHAEIDEYVEPLVKACPDCSIESTECATQLNGIEKALADDNPLPVYTVRAEGVRMSVVGAPRQTRLWCEAVASEMVKRGLSTAACVFPAEKL